MKRSIRKTVVAMFMSCAIVLPLTTNVMASEITDLKIVDVYSKDNGTYFLKEDNSFWVLKDNEESFKIDDNVIKIFDTETRNMFVLKEGNELWMYEVFVRV